MNRTDAFVERAAKQAESPAENHAAPPQPEAAIGVALPHESAAARCTRRLACRGMRTRASCRWISKR
jgi:hypothetical protein